MEHEKNEPRRRPPERNSRAAQAAQQRRDQRREQAHLEELRQKQRKRARHRTRHRINPGVWKRILIMAAVVAAVVLSMVLFFRVRSVEVTGSAYYTADEIRAACGVAQGDNLLTLSRARIAGNIMAELPYVSTVQVTRRLPDTLESIGPYALDGQYTGDFSPLAALILPDGVRELSDCSIYGCWEIHLLRFPATLTEIPAYCVANCGLGAVEIPEGVTRIGEFAFYYYDWEQTELSAVTLPASVEFVGFRAFPDECEITALNPDTHFETEEEINQRNPDWAYRIP